MEKQGQRKFKFLLFLILMCYLGSMSAEKVNKKSACNSQHNTICRNILKLKPTLDEKTALNYSNSIYRYSKKYDIDSNLIVAIAFQESGFDKKAIRKDKGVMLDELTGKFKEVIVGFDFCLMQLSYWNIQKKEISLKRLMQDSDYCILQGVQILSDFKKMYSSKEAFWWTRYNASTLKYREEYQRKVERHLVKIIDPVSPKAKKQYQVATR